MSASSPNLWFSSSPTPLHRSIPILPIVPPVPSALQHPASWGIGARVVLPVHTHTIDYAQVFACVHPAAVSSTVVMPPAVQTRIQADGDGEDVDEFNIYSERLENQLHLVETEIYLRINRLQHLAKSSANIDAIRAKRCRISDALSQAYWANDPKVSEKVTYIFRPAQINNVADENNISAKQDLCASSNDSDEQCGRYVCMYVCMHVCVRLFDFQLQFKLILFLS